MAEERAVSAAPEVSSPARPQAENPNPAAAATAAPTDTPTGADTVTTTAPLDGHPAQQVQDDVDAQDGHPAQQIEVDDDTSHAEDGYQTASETSSRASASLTSSIRDYNFENRRRYHKYKEGQYHFPNDDPEQEREDMKHAMVVHLCGGSLHSAPLENPQKVLDVGTGTGIWAIDMGDEYPEADIIGIDLSPIQPDFVPPNVQFIVDDAEVEWVYPDDTFDYVHLRNMAPSIKKWPELFAEAYRVLKPGGWIEMQEMRWVYGCDDGTIGPDYAPAKMGANIKEGLARLGVEMNAAESYPTRVENAGFVNLQHEVKKVPVGPWAKDNNLRKIGDYCLAAIYDGLHAITIGPFTRGLGWSPVEVEVFLIQVRKDLLNPAIHAHVYFHSLSAQKPDAPENE
ncbi:TAM domain methyltransferase [Colletotrichum higginsianum]|uniref:TAM domain methyltransferase n=2 Tax=Colletotrichum higginsianum TaxID=80884 RepID=H1VS84_COLHI|nr:TAM domain methyltransferase [Colletotrichum higginsianum IMI 349063]OBR03236.1 TAM domain methyltransferase [Colletotrichum higginsianum IMI 349063]TIC90030.1 Secondary metabolism regulator LAE1 [Colletotrichum higginsianum]GJD02410.1 TAM domain methyltransferase [Colletotrichum higginsianum]CCF43091.1 TAM domain methyltransferase [Colletotrichum higginsianum]